MKRSGLTLAGLKSTLAIVFALALHSGAIAAPAEDTLAVDLAPLIDEAAKRPERFAVDLPHTVTTTDAGTWAESGSRVTWTYAVRVPSAISLSFHAPRVSLPPSAILTVAANNGTKISYRTRDIARSGLWSRPLPGDSLTLTLSMNAADRAQTHLQIESVQAGYRSLGAGTQNHAHYQSLLNASPQPSSCTVNYACEVTSANAGPAHATVGILVANVDQCTGTLLNDTRGDGAPYVLTARHCEQDMMGGGAPEAAANVTVYWDAVSPCGAALGSIFDANAITQTGATTVVEQQDAWLILLDAPPVASDAYYSGWDATGGIFSGGYSIHHALGYNKQLTDWYGQPILQTIPGATLNLSYASTFWGVVNATGNVGPGASGGALFDPNNNAVGGLTLGLTSGSTGWGVCPATPLKAPSASNVAAYYTALSAVWNSTADTSSTTGSVTLQSVLDSAKTGKLVVDGAGRLPVSLTASQSNLGTGTLLSLTWSAPGAQSCTASGGLSGDGWAGSRNASGTFSLTEQSGSSVTYSIACTAPNLAGSASATVSWTLVPASVSLTGTGPTAVAGRQIELQWSANAQPCLASGGTSGDGWIGSKAQNGTQSVLASVLGTVTYTLTCGSGGRTATAQYAVSVVAPTVSAITGDANQLRAGQTVNLQFVAGGSCVASGGAAGDGWAGPLATSDSSGALGYSPSVTEAVAGTYTYTVTCSGAGATAGLTSTKSITLTFTSASPTASLSATPSPVEIYTDPGSTAVLSLSWTSNVRPCAITYVGPGNIQGQVNGTDLAAGLPAGAGADDQPVAGAYVYTLTCGTGANQAQATAAATWFTNAPAVTLNVANPMPRGVATPVVWNSNVYPCTGTGGASGDGWAGNKPGAIGSQPITEAASGNITFGITCGTGSQTVQAQASTATVASQVSITASASSLPVNGVLQLHWTSNFEPCTSTISPGSPGGWGTVLPETGGFQTTEEVAGTYTYSISCAGIQASTQVTFTGSLTTITSSASSVSVGTPVTLSWNSPVNATSCTAGGGTPGDGWAGSLAIAGTQIVTSQTATTVTYSVSCDFGYGPSLASTEVTYAAAGGSDAPLPTPQVTLSTSTGTQTVGAPVTISWAAQNADACSATGGVEGDGWSGALAPTGTMSVTESSAGSFSYGITCTGAPPAASAEAKVNFTSASVTVTGSSGKGGGGGGAVDELLLTILASLGICRVTGRRIAAT